MLHSLFTYTELHLLFIYAFYILFYRVTSFFNLHCLCPWTTNTKWSVSSILDISPRLVAMDTYNNDVISKLCLELNNKCFQFKSILNKFTPKLLHHQSLKPPNLHSGLFSFSVMVLSYLHTKHWNRHRNCLSTKINSLWKKKIWNKHSFKLLSLLDEFRRLQWQLVACLVDLFSVGMMIFLQTDLFMIGAPLIWIWKKSVTLKTMKKWCNSYHLKLFVHGFWHWVRGFNLWPYNLSHHIANSNHAHYVPVTKVEI